MERFLFWWSIALRLLFTGASTWCLALAFVNSGGLWLLWIAASFSFTHEVRRVGDEYRAHLQRKADAKFSALLGKFVQ